jgi:hypothetical protein
MRRALIILAVVVAAVVVMALAFKGRQMKSKTDVASVQKDIREHLPIGSSRAEVSAFLDQRKISHSHVSQVPEVPENNHTEMAMIRGVSENRGIRGDIQIVFKFDDNDAKLVGYSVREIFTGP